MEQYSEERLSKLGFKDFKRLLGVDRATFMLMCIAVEHAYEEIHKRRGRKRKLMPREMVILFLLYIKQYNAMADYAFQLNTSKSVICDNIHFVLKSLLKNKNFTLFGSKCVQKDDSEDKLIDVTEIRIERPKYNQSNKYSGKKKYHTMKIQIIKGEKTGFIYEIQIGLGAEHDFHLFKRTFKGSPNNVCYTADLGYIGIDKIHSNCLVPSKNSKNHKLTDDEKEFNKLISATRIFIEHTNSWIKRFKLLSTKFRNDLSYFAPLAVLICALYNLDIA